LDGEGVLRLTFDAAGADVGLTIYDGKDVPRADLAQRRNYVVIPGRRIH